MRRCVVIAVLLAAGTASGQGVFSDVMSGKLINPEVGVFARYELVDNATGQKLYVRQAIVGEKQVADTVGYYLETEVMPEVGFPIVYRMLLTGPATDPANVHEIMVKDGTHPVTSVPVDMLLEEEESDDEGQPSLRDSLGTATVSTPAGTLETEHFSISRGDRTTKVWANDDVRPMGIVKMVSDDGELRLTGYGKGGADAESAIDRNLREQERDDVKVEVTPGGPTRNFSGRASEE